MPGRKQLFPQEGCRRACAGTLACIPEGKEGRCDDMGPTMADAITGASYGAGYPQEALHH
ncbi:hypothetical protein CXU22_08905 [Akkermansia muciniphila]|uniref:Uncharacterized protein n=1 Tax=Akkermansia muciniphila TaxID=239935 RepID=A0A2N8HD99_9BACT|nr:hypothetical protein CXU22_08905 [Akkermansia muciniphila]